MGKFPKTAKLSKHPLRSAQGHRRGLAVFLAFFIFIFLNFLKLLFLKRKLPVGLFPVPPLPEALTPGSPEGRPGGCGRRAEGRTAVFREAAALGVGKQKEKQTHTELRTGELRGPRGRRLAVWPGWGPPFAPPDSPGCPP